MLLVQPSDYYATGVKPRDIPGHIHSFFKRIQDLSSKLDALTRCSAWLLLIPQLDDV